MKMNNQLYYTTVSPLLLKVLSTLMVAPIFNPFRLVGGTALSLLPGHRLSVDIDLFTDAEYDSIDFNAIDRFLRETFPYVDTTYHTITGMGKYYFVGDSKEESIKLDLFYTDNFIQKFLLIDKIRIATVEEIIAMKIDVILRGGRKKDFWDIHELISEYSLMEMLALHEKRYPYTHNENTIRQNFTNFDDADHDFDPHCFRSKYWEIVKLDLLEFAGLSF